MFPKILLEDTAVNLCCRQLLDSRYSGTLDADCFDASSYIQYQTHLDHDLYVLEISMVIQTD